MYLTVLVPFCDVRYDFRITTMFSSSLPTVVCRRAYVLFTLFALIANIGVQDILCFFLFYCLRLAYPMLPVSLDCLCMIAL
jgi:hypothetical protein